MRFGGGLSVLALTAGLGTRLRPYTEQRAKPALPFLGVPLALHALRHLEDLPVRELYLNLHHLPETIRDLDFYPLRLPKPQYSDESAGILGGGGALHLIIDELAEKNILLLNGDEVFLPKDPWGFRDAYKDHLGSGRLATLITMQHPEVGVHFGGAWTDEHNRVVRFHREKQNSLVGHHYVGYVFLNSRIRNYFKSQIAEENILYETLTRALAQGEEVLCFDMDAHWYETGQTPLFLESTKLLLDLLEKKPAVDAGVQAFLNFIRNFPQPELLIERQDPALCARLQAFWSSLNAL